MINTLAYTTAVLITMAKSSRRKVIARKITWNKNIYLKIKMLFVSSVTYIHKSYKNV